MLKATHLAGFSSSNQLGVWCRDAYCEMRGVVAVAPEVGIGFEPRLDA